MTRRRQRAQTERERVAPVVFTTARADAGSARVADRRTPGAHQVKGLGVDRAPWRLCPGRAVRLLHDARKKLTARLADAGCLDHARTDRERPSAVLYTAWGSIQMLGPSAEPKWRPILRVCALSQRGPYLGVRT